VNFRVVNVKVSFYQKKNWRLLGINFGFRGIINRAETDFFLQFSNQISRRIPISGISTRFIENLVTLFFQLDVVFGVHTVFFPGRLSKRKVKHVMATTGMVCLCKGVVDVLNFTF
jgi:hypothetical protein